MRALFGLDPLAVSFNDVLAPDFDRQPIRKAVAELIASMKARKAGGG